MLWVRCFSERLGPTRGDVVSRPVALATAQCSWIPREAAPGVKRAEGAPILFSSTAPGGRNCPDRDIRAMVVAVMSKMRKTMGWARFSRAFICAPLEGSIGRLAHDPKQSGLTLIELMVVIVLVAIVLSVGVASYSQFSTSNTVVAELHSLRASIALARSEAVTTGTNIIVCSSNDPTSAAPTCSGTNEWNTGWAVLSPSAGSCLATSGQGAPFAVQGPLLSQNTIVFTPLAGGTAPTSFCFNRGGFPVAPSVPGMFVFNTKKTIVGDRLCLSVNPAGHMQTLGSGQGGCP